MILGKSHIKLLNINH